MASMASGSNEIRSIIVLHHALATWAKKSAAFTRPWYIGSRGGGQPAALIPAHFLDATSHEGDRCTMFQRRGHQGVAQLATCMQAYREIIVGQRDRFSDRIAKLDTDTQALRCQLGLGNPARFSVHCENRFLELPCNGCGQVASSSAKLHDPLRFLIAASHKAVRT